MKSRLIVGVDVSKLTLDFFFKPSGSHMMIDNKTAGFKKWLKALQRNKRSFDDVLIVMEHTGHYSFRFEKFLIANHIPYCKLAALEIKRSLGVIRGKNDKIDAERIAEYAWLRKDVLQEHNVIGKDIVRLKDLVSLRKKLVRDRSGFLCRQKEMTETGKLSAGDVIVAVQTRMIETLSRQIQLIEKEIKDVIQSNEELLKNYR